MLGGLLSCLLLIGADAALLLNRPHRLEVQTHEAPGRVWLIAGLDDRSALPDGPDVFGRPDSAGARADVLLLVREGGGQPTVLSLPRGLVLKEKESFHRLGHTWLTSPQLTVDLLCTHLGVGVTDVVSINMRGLERLVDALGGVTVTLPQPLRDRYAHIDLPAGQQHVDGATALGLVRSRQGEVFVDGAWVADPEGAHGRQRRAAEVAHAISASASSASWWTMHQAAWRVTPDVGLSGGTSLLSLPGLVRGDPQLRELPFAASKNGDIGPPNDQTMATLSELGLTGCH